jgi:predicted transcriptional regulator
MEAFSNQIKGSMMSEDTPPTQTSSDQLNYLELTADLVAAFVSNNAVRPSDLPELISTIHSTLGALTAGGTRQASEAQVEKPTPAQIKKSITHDALISFEDGKPYKSLRRHLNGKGLTAEAYREKYGLPRDYPMTAAGYSAQRSELARSSGLGQQRRKSDEAPSSAGDTQSDAPKAGRGRPKKAAAE